MNPESASRNSEIVDRLLNSRLLQTDWVLYFLLGLVAIAAVVVLWKLVYFGLNALRVRDVRLAISELVKTGDFASFEQRIAENGSDEARVLRAGLAYRPVGTDAVEQQLDVALGHRRRAIEVGLTFLGTVGANAPFLGLYGTVGGIVKAFRDLASDSEEGVNAVIAGIAEALVATAVGLIVAIPAVVAFNYLNKHVARVVASSDGLNKQLLLRLRGGG